ncbi:MULTISPECIES: S-layer homology domain-containing protein [Paenibacillus]|uniref:SLH domain-containing protein n=1 Tax=Paenibacillus odorifer TaxID=189426 RepID=A0ABX3GT27_9BACL|nr:S-layer homology domain-containing protein [Paenibacillus odorifer]OMD34652.1 hypothetical protein BSO21_10835 [Paenibacillus odorifer]
MFKAFATFSTVALFVSSLFTFAPPVEAADASWVKQVEVFDDGSYILKSNGDLMYWDGNELKKVTGHITSISEDGDEMAVKDNGNLIELSRDTYKTIKLPEKVGKVKQVLEKKYVVNQIDELWNTEKETKLLDNVNEAVSGANHVLALTNDGTLWSWGGDNWGSLGNGTKNSNDTPEIVLKNISKIAAYMNNSAAINSNGELYLWGQVNYNNEIGNDQTPQKVLDNVKDFSLTETCAAITNNNELYMWGNGSSGQLGNDTEESLKAPTLIMGKVKYVDVSSEKTIAIRENGEVWGWGNKNYFYEKSADYYIKTPIKLIDAQPIPVFPVTGKYKMSSSWAQSELPKAEEIGLLIPVIQYNLNKSITREQFSEVVIKYYEAMIGKNVPEQAKNPFLDTKNKQVIKAYNLGIVNGISKDRFEPSKSITREEICVMLKRALDKARPNFEYNYTYSRFEDESKFASFAQEPIKYLRSLGVVKGDSNNLFNPRAKTTIEEAVIMSYRLFEITD